MRGNEFLDKMELIDPAYVEGAEAQPKKKAHIWVKWGAMAASLCLVAAGAFAAAELPDTAGKPVPDPNGTNEHPSVGILPGKHSQGPQDMGTLVFNEAAGVVDPARRYIPGYFTEELNSGELTAIEPDKKAPDMKFSGYAGFDGYGKLVDVCLEVNAPFLQDSAAVNLSYGEPLRCYKLPGEPVISTVNNIDFTVYQWSPDGSGYWLEACGNINECSVRIAYETTGASLERAKEDFAVILDCFSHYEDGRPDLSSIRADTVPEFINQKLTLAGAQNDEHFGNYMLRELPDGFEEESIRRYKDQKNDYLSGLWINGYSEIQWKIYNFHEEAGERVTGVSDTKNYDLSLYPIPRALSVPSELRSIVDNPVFLAEELTLDAVMARAYKMEDAGGSGDWRMEFSVKYENIVIEVRTIGVEPEWVYQQLLSFRGK